ncbi:MAG TPA: dephospho-CoA kinase [Gaiellaceae bacterium]|jgi:dephospho-CoA kinase
MRPLTVAVTGGIGAGKSAALAAFARRGVPTSSADDVVHRLIAEDPEVRAALEDRLGTTDRAEIGRIVFADPERLAWLEGLLHPRVRRDQEAWLAGLDADAAVIEIPLLFETGGEERFDAVVVITAPDDVRARRTARARDARGARLIPDAEKVARADFAYVNDGTLDELDAFVEDVLRRVSSSRLHGDT